MTNEHKAYTLRDGDAGIEATIEASSVEEAERLASEWIVRGYERGEKTIWLDVAIREASGGDEWTVTVALDPAVPECDGDRAHNWQAPHDLVGGIAENPGVWGQGGGVVVSEVCMRCGTERRTDTWAQRPDTGEQGLTSVRYERGKFADEVRHKSGRIDCGIAHGEGDRRVALAIRELRDVVPRARRNDRTMIPVVETNGNPVAILVDPSWVLSDDAIDIASAGEMLDVTAIAIRDAIVAALPAAAEWGWDLGASEACAPSVRA